MEHAQECGAGQVKPGTVASMIWPPRHGVVVVSPGLRSVRWRASTPQLMLDRRTPRAVPPTALTVEPTCGSARVNLVGTARNCWRDACSLIDCSCRRTAREPETS